MSDPIRDEAKYNGESMSEPPTIKNAVIKSVSLGIEDHGSLSAWLDLEYVSGGQGFGGYALYLPKSFSHHQLGSVAGHFIFRVLEIGGVTEWSKLPGKCIRVIGTDSEIESIGHIIKDEWFRPSDEFKPFVEGSRDYE